MDPTPVRRLTTLFPVFLGLRLLPVGLWFLSLALPLPGTLPHPIHVVLFVLAVAAVWWADRWYRDRYGLVEAERQRFGRSWMLVGGLAAAYLALAGGSGRLETGSLVLVLALILFAAGVGWALPRFLSGTWMALAIVLVALIGAAILAALPRDAAGLGAVGWLFSLGLGAVLCAAGVAEHRSLAAAFAGRPENLDV